jgi:glucose/mannose-6-phosphate isomerase
VSAESSLDTLGVWDEAATLPAQLVEALDWSRENVVIESLARYAIRSVVAVGLGAAGTACEAIASLSAADLAIPLTVGHGGELPAFVDRYSLVIALAASPGSAETDAAVRAAHAVGAHVLTVGHVGEGRPSFVLSTASEDAVRCPAITGARSGRVTLAGLVVPVLVALERLRLGRDWDGDLRAAADVLAVRRDALMAPGGIPEVLARHIGRTFPLVYGSPGIGAIAARWWKDEVNRNAKSPAFASELPDVTYGELAGWGQSGDVTRQVLTLIELRHSGERQRTADLFAAVTSATDEVMADILEVEAIGADDLTRFFDLALIGQLVSLHLAAQEGVDPGPTPALDEARAGGALPSSA